MRSVYILLFLVLVSCINPRFTHANYDPDYLDKEISSPPFLAYMNDHWVDSIMSALTPDERIAQLFMVAAYSNKGDEHVAQINQLITKYKIGGLIFFQGGPIREAKLTNQYQDSSKAPLLIAIDGEWGLAMRLDSTMQFPHQMTLGAIQNEQLIYQMGREIGRQCQRLGIQVNFAPVVDVNSNPLNPVIGNRSFGDNKLSVASLGIQYMNGLQDSRVLANAKHFPGHGDTDKDSHKELPIITHSKETIDTLDLYPFKQLIKNGLGSMMVAHLYIPALDSTPNRASTLSKIVVDSLLKKQLNFQGLIFTDALNMKGVSSFYKPGEVAVKALLAGNDVLLFPEDVPTAIEQIKKAIADTLITQEEIDYHCRKILAVKKWTGLDKWKPLELKNLYEDLHTPEAQLINSKLAESSITLLKNKNNLIPLKRLDTLSIASLAINCDSDNIFQEMLGNYTNVQTFRIGKEPSENQIKNIIDTLQSYNLIVISLHNATNNPRRNFGIADATIDLIKTLSKQKKVILDIFANPYSLSQFDANVSLEALIMSYEDSPLFESSSAQMIFGGISSLGKLPINVSSQYTRGMGMQTENASRLKYTIPEEVGIHSIDLNKIDSIAYEAINSKATPGCEILIAKDGKIFYQKSFGHFTYDDTSTVVNNKSIYDLASVTKVSATLPSIMRLYDQKKLNLDATLQTYLPEATGTNKGNLIIKEILSHKAGLQGWIPFYTETMKDGDCIPAIYSCDSTGECSVKVARELFIKGTYRDTIFKKILASSLLDKKDYLYSDLGFYLMMYVAEKQTGTQLDKYVNENFYKPLGATTLGYKPLDRFQKNRIVPTENDQIFRKQLVQGYVHDPGAAMMGGVCGHAGIFSDANDLAKLMQMYLWKGSYGGEKYFDSTTVNEFTKCHYCAENNRRALGFDRKDPSGGVPCSCVSAESFGHTGFTGTIVWMDPDNGVLYIFLSNRVYPDATNSKLNKMSIRSRIQEVVYDAINKTN